MRKRTKSDGIPAWSWGVAALGLMLVAGSTGFMLYRGLTGNSSPPNLVIEVDRVWVRGSDFLVPITITNTGESVAAGLVVEGLVGPAATPLETSSVTIDYVPSRSTRRASLIFKHDPRRFGLRVQAKGYAVP